MTGDPIQIEQIDGHLVEPIRSERRAIWSSAGSSARPSA